MGINRSGRAVPAGVRGVKSPGKNFSVASVHEKLYNHESVGSLCEWVPSIADASRNSWGEAPGKRRHSNSLRHNYIGLTSGATRGVRTGEMLRGLNAA